MRQNYCEAQTRWVNFSSLPSLAWPRGYAGSACYTATVHAVIHHATIHHATISPAAVASHQLYTFSSHDS